MANSKDSAQLNLWLQKNGLGKFSEVLNKDSITLDMLWQSSKFELFQMFQDLELKASQCVRLRLAVTSDERWRGGDTTLLFALREGTFKKVERIAEELANTHETLARVAAASDWISQICDMYIEATVVAVNHLRQDARSEVGEIQATCEEKRKKLTRAQSEIEKAVKKHKHHTTSRERCIDNVLLSLRDTFAANCGVKEGIPEAPTPNVEELRRVLGGMFINPTGLRFGLKWSEKLRGEYVTLEESGKKAINSTGSNWMCTGVRATEGWNQGEHSWKIRVSSTFETNGCETIMLGVCTEKLRKSDFCSDKSMQHIEGKTGCWGTHKSFMGSHDGVIKGQDDTFAKSGEVVELNLNMNERALSFRILRYGEDPFLVIKTPGSDGCNLYPYVVLYCGSYENAATFVD